MKIVKKSLISRISNNGTRMGRVVVSEYVTLDGAMEDPGGGEKSRHGGWSFSGTKKQRSTSKMSCLLRVLSCWGRATYQGFAKAWPSIRDEEGFADRMNAIPKYVVSTTLQKVEWNNSKLIKGNIAEEVIKLKQQQGQDILVAGSAQLVGTLMQHDLIDEYRLMAHPVVPGSGKRRLFKRGSIGRFWGS